MDDRNTAIGEFQSRTSRTAAAATAASVYDCGKKSVVEMSAVFIVILVANYVHVN